MHRPRHRALGTLVIAGVALSAAFLAVRSMDGASTPAAGSATQVEDRVLPDKTAYLPLDRKADPSEVFRYPLDEERNFIKRIRPGPGFGK